MQSTFTSPKYAIDFSLDDTDKIFTASICDSNGSQLLFTRIKRDFPEDIHFYTDRSEQTEVLTISKQPETEKAGVFYYDVIDTKTGKRLGIIQVDIRARVGCTLALTVFVSLFGGMVTEGEGSIKFRIMNPSGVEIVRYKKPSLADPFTYKLYDNNTDSLLAIMNFRKQQLDLSPDTRNILDKRLAIAFVVMKYTVEPRMP